MTFEMYNFSRVYVQNPKPFIKQICVLPVYLCAAWSETLNTQIFLPYGSCIIDICRKAVHSLASFASDSGGVRNLPPSCCVLGKALFSLEVLLISRKWWLRPDMTEKLLTGKLS